MRRAAASLLLLLAAGCSQLPEYRRPPAPVTGLYPPGFDPGGVGRTAVETSWREFFGDPRLQVLIGQALETNRDLRVATARIEEARARYRIVRADRLPRVDLEASSRTGEGRSDGDFHSVSVSAPAYELDFWGRVRGLNEAARGRFLETAEARNAFQLSLLADLAEAYLIERELEEQLGLAERTLRSRRESLRLARLRFREGEGTNLEVQQELTLVAQTQGRAAELRAEQARTGNFLVLLVGRPLGPDLPPPRPLGGQITAPDLPAGLPAQLLVNRPDIRAAEQALIAANADVGVARAAFLPRISLTGALGFASPELENLLDGDSLGAEAGAGLLQPLFDGGRNRAGLDLARAQRATAVAEYERTVQTAFREVADALAARRFFADQLAALRIERSAQIERLRLAELLFLEGESDNFEVLDARQRLFAVEQSLLTIRRAELANAVTLYTALGGGLQ